MTDTKLTPRARETLTCIIPYHQGPGRRTYLEALNTSEGYVSVGRVFRSWVPRLGSVSYGGRLAAFDAATRWGCR